jgi:hypothetical protein
MSVPFFLSAMDANNVEIVAAGLCPEPTADRLTMPMGGPCSSPHGAHAQKEAPTPLEPIENRDAARLAESGLAPSGDVVASNSPIQVPTVSEDVSDPAHDDADTETDTVMGVNELADILQQLEDPPPLLEQVADQPFDPSPPPVVEPIAAQEYDMDLWEHNSVVAESVGADSKPASEAGDFDDGDEMSAFGDGHHADDEEEGEAGGEDAAAAGAGHRSEPEDDEEEGEAGGEDAAAAGDGYRSEPEDDEEEGSLQGDFTGPEAELMREAAEEEAAYVAELHRRRIASMQAKAAEAEAAEHRRLAFLAEAEKHGLRRLASVQAQRSFPGAAEAAANPGAADALIKAADDSTTEEEEDAPAEPAPAEPAPARPPSPPPFAFVMELGLWQEFNKILLGAEVDTGVFWTVVFGTPEPPVAKPGKRKLPDFGAAGKSPRNPRAAGKSPRKPAGKGKAPAPAEQECIEISDGEYAPPPEAKRCRQVLTPRAQPRRDCKKPVVIDLEKSDDEMEGVIAYERHDQKPLDDDDSDDPPPEIYIRGINPKGKMCMCRWCGAQVEGCDDCIAFRHWMKSVCEIRCSECPESDIVQCCEECDGDKRFAYSQWLAGEESE